MKNELVSLSCLKLSARCLTLLATLFLALVTSSVFAGTFTAFGPQGFTRGNGKPVVESTNFSIKNPDTSYTLNIYNGGDGSEYKKVSSAIIELNNSNIFGTKDFKQKITLLEKEVSLSSSNELEVELRSIPDSGLTVLIEGDDNSPPDITISSPADGTYLNTPLISVRGTASDSISWVETVSVNGASANLSDESFSVSNIQLTEGTNDITATATDAAGNTGSDSATIILDTIAPVINLNTTATITNNPSFEISGSVNDTSPITSVTVKGIPVNLSNNTFITTVNLVEGNNSITVSATDKAGNSSEASVTVILDTIAPVITLEPDDSLTNNPLFNITGELDDANPITSLIINGTTVAFSNSTFSTDINLIEGDNSITISATDKAGNSGEFSVTALLDTISPQITLDELPGLTNNESVQVKGSVSDASPLLSVMMNGRPVALEENNFTATLVLSEGVNIVTLYAEDVAGNTNTETFEVVLDTIAPAILVTSPQNGCTVDTDTISVAGTIDDSAARVTVNGKPAEVSGNSFSVPGITLPQGENNITITAIDTAGNIASHTSFVTYVAFIGPEITFLFPQDGRDFSSMDSPMIMVTLSVDDASSFVLINGIVATLSTPSPREPAPLPGQDLLGGSDGTFYAFIQLNEGGNEITAVATNRTNGSTSTKSITVYFRDVLPPQLQISEPYNYSSSTKNETINITGRVYDYSEDISIEVNGITGFVSNNYFTVSDVPLDAGDNYLTITATDQKGNTTSVARLVHRVVDTVPPVISIKSPKDGTTVTTNAVDVWGYISEGNVKVTVNGVEATVFATSYTANGINIVEGENNIEITATDPSGNMAIKSIVVYVDTTPPIISYTTPTDNGTEVSASAPITALFNENICVTGAISDWFELRSEFGNVVTGTLTCNGNAVTFAPIELLEPITTYYALVMGVKDENGNEMQEEYIWSFKTEYYSIPIDLVIHVPQNGVTINSSLVMVRGTVSSETPDLGIKVNGVLAEINGNEWVVVVPIREGENNIIVEANNGLGESGKANIIVNGSGGISPVTISANPSSGIAPLEATFDIETKLGAAVTRYMIDYEGDGVVDKVTTSVEGITNTYYTAGLYYPVLTVNDASGSTYTSTIVVNVLDVEQMDVILKTKWDGMKGDLRTGDIEQALKSFSNESKERYEGIFTVLQGKLADIAEGMQEIQLIYLKDGRAKYRIRRMENGEEITYYIYFARDEDGMWKVHRF